MMSDKTPTAPIPGTTIFDTEQARKGYQLNQFCMSLMSADNRQQFKANESLYLDRWAITAEQKQAVLDRDYSRLIELGGNIYFLVKIGATDGKSVVSIVSSMTEESEQEYIDMMRRGGRSPNCGEK